MVKTIIGLPGTKFDKKEKSRHGQDGMLKAGTFRNPYVEDDYQLIRGVGWSGSARFVLGWAGNNPNEASFLQHVDVTGKDKSDPNQLTLTSDISNNDSNPVLCVAGGIIGADKDGNGGTPAFVAAIAPGTTINSGSIMYSSDGINWETVYTQPEIGGDTFVGSSAWICTFDGTQFWAAVNLHTNGQDVSEINIYDILLSSQDGRSWGQAGQNIINFNDWPTYDDHNGLIVPHLDQRVMSNDGFGAPSGMFGERKMSDGSSIIIRPGDFSISTFDAGIFYSSDSSITVIGGKKSGNDPGIRVSSVTYGGKSTGVWLAAGPAPFTVDGPDPAAAISTDDGQTWTQIQGLPPAGDQAFGGFGCCGIAGVPLKLLP